MLTDESESVSAESTRNTEHTGLGDKETGGGEATVKQQFQRSMNDCFYLASRRSCSTGCRGTRSTPPPPAYTFFFLLILIESASFSLYPEQGSFPPSLAASILWPLRRTSFISRTEHSVDLRFVSL